MKLSAALDVAAKRIRRELDTQSNSRKSIFIAMASVFFVGSFFYSLAQVTVYKTSLSPLAKYFPVREANGRQYLSHPAYAQELGNPQLASEIEALICRETPPTLSVTDPNLELYRLEDLCQAFNTVEAYFALEGSSPTDPGQQTFKQDLEKILQGTPMEAMIEPISQKDRTVGAFLVGIAFKESTLGKFAPRKNGRDCFNYWGYKGPIDPVAGGYACFASPQQAVDTVGARIETYVAKGRTTPANFTMWKCGSSCATHSPESVASWISGVSRYFFQLNKS